MIKSREILGVIAILVLIVLWQRKDTKIVEVTLPVRTNTKVITNPQPINEGKKELVVTNFETIKITNPLNDTLVQRYLAAKDSLARLNTFIDATKQRDYVGILDDSLQTVTVNTRVNGFIREQVITYKTKEQKVKIRVKERKRLYAGGEVVMPTQIGRAPTLGGKVNLVSQKTLISIGYDLQGTATAGISFRVF